MPHANRQLQDDARPKRSQLFALVREARGQRVQDREAEREADDQLDRHACPAARRVRREQSHGRERRVADEPRHEAEDFEGSAGDAERVV